MPGYDSGVWYGVLAPAGTPRSVINQINKEVGRVLESPEVKERLLAMGFIPAPTTPEEFEKIVRADIETFRKVGKIAGLIAP